MSATWIALLIALLIAVDVLIFLRIRNARRRRRRDSAPSAWVWGSGSNVYAVGATEREGIGAFQGFVYAMASGNGTEGDRMLCVNDASRDEPIWVRRSEVASLKTSGPGAPEGDFRRPASRVT